MRCTRLENIEELWQKILDKLKESMSKASFDTWLSETKVLEITRDEVTVLAPNDFTKNWLDQRYQEVINQLLFDLTGEQLKIKFTLNEASEQVASILTQPKSTEPTHENLLNPKYTFNTFVVGSANRFAHAASLAVAEAPTKSYNPLFIYGGVGLGKTHLMHAIAHFVQEHHPQLNVIYLSSEKFTNEFINAIMDNKTDNFRNKYRKVDILLVDDVQFLAGKEQTQEEFFHTFNTLHEENKQIIISSDRPPREIPTLEERLRSRFEWGLITDISPPDLETRIAILTKKAKAEGLEDLSTDVLHYIANQVDTNIRELEGALIRVIAYSSLVNEDVNVNLAAQALQNIIKNQRPKTITIKMIQKFIAEKFNITINEILSKKRTKTIAYPRQIAMYLARELTDSSLPKIGEQFGKRDHTTILHGHKKISEMILDDESFENEINIYIEELKNNLK